MNNSLTENNQKEKAKILIVDDNKVNSEILKEFLEEYFDITISNNGYEAIEIVKNNKIDLVLLDIMMPEISGFEVCKIIKEDNKSRNIPVIMVTARTDVKDRVKGLEIGADDYIVRPFDFEELVARINSHLRIYRLQEQIARSKIENELNRLKLDFLSIVSHELRTPLHSVLGFSELILIDTELTDRQINYMKEIYTGGLRLRELIENLLLFTEISSETYDKEKKQIKIYETFQEVKEIFNEKLAKKSIELEIIIEEDFTLFLVPEIFKQIIFKIVDNAIKFSKKDSKIIASASKNGELCEIKITDFGIGIPDEMKSQVFRLFEQGNQSYITRRHEGLGLGLALVLKLVERINGNIRIEDNQPNGSSFIVNIPLK